MFPLGASKTAVRPPSANDATVSVTVILPIWRVLFELTVRVESSVPAPAVVAAGIAWSIEVEPKVCGARIEPLGPMIDSTWLGMKLFTCTGRSKVTLNWLVESSVSRLALPVAGPTAVRLCEPLDVTVAFDESVIVVTLSTAAIVVPDAIPVPVTVSPANSPDVVPMPVTSA